MPRTHFLSYRSHIIPFAAPDEYETIYKYDAFYNLVEQELRLYTDGNLNRYKGEKYDIAFGMDKDFYTNSVEYITSLKKKGRFQFNDLEVEPDGKLGEIEFYEGNLKLKIMGVRQLSHIPCFFMIYNEVYYLVGFHE